MIEDPFERSSEIESALIEMEKVYSVFDLLYEIWEPTYSETRNLQLILNFLSKYTVNQPNIHCMDKARKMKHVITELKSLWSQSGVVRKVYHKKDLHGFIDSISTASLTSDLLKDFLPEESFNEWLHNYKKYLKDTVTNNELNMPTTSKTIDHGTASDCQNNETSSSSVPQVDFQPATAGPNITNNETETKEKETGAFNALFSSIFQKDEANARISQFIKQSENGQQFTLSTPGETASDCKVVRLAVFDVKDVTKSKERDWMTSAKLRSQFLTSMTDNKWQLLNQLFCLVTTELNKIPGAKPELKPYNQAGTSNN